MKRKTLAASAATVLAGAVLVGTALVGTVGAAAATNTPPNPPTNSFIISPTGVHNAPDSEAPVTQVLAAGTRVAALCVEPLGSDEGGNQTWFRIATNQPGGGWVPRAALGGVPPLPECSPGDQ